MISRYRRFGRLRKEAAPPRSSGHAILYTADCRDLGAIADSDVIVEAYPCAKPYMVADCDTPSDGHRGGDQAAPSNDHVVGDLDLIVDFGAFADYRIAQAAAIDARSNTNFNVILNFNTRAV